MMNLSKNKVVVDQQNSSDVSNKMLGEQMAELNKRFEEKNMKIEKALNDITKKLQETRRKKSSNDELKEKLLKAVSDTTLHGVPRIFKSENKVLRIMWTIMILISMISCLYLVIKNMTDFYSYPVITNIERVYENRPPFPKVEILGSHSLEYCQFNGEVCGDSFRNFLYVFKAFNSGSNNLNEAVEFKKSKAPGKHLGLDLVINSYSGSRIYIYNQTIQADKAIFVFPGTIMTIVLSRKIENKLSKPYSDCKAEVSLKDIKFTDKDIIKKNSFRYSQSSCFELCFLKDISKACNKTEEFDKFERYYYTNYIYFLISKYETLDCNKHLVDKVFEKFATEGQNELCKDECSTECNSVTYTMTISDQFNQKLLEKNQSQVSIYYDEFYYTKITEQPKYSVDGLVGTIGGLLGLFMGASLLSSVEFLDLVFNLFF